MYVCIYNKYKIWSSTCENFKIELEAYLVGEQEEGHGVSKSRVNPFSLGFRFINITFRLDNYALCDLITFVSKAYFDKCRKLNPTL